MLVRSFGRDSEIELRLERGLVFVPTPEMKRVSGVTWANADNLIWHVAYLRGSQAIGVVGSFIKGGVARFRTDVVLPEYRGQGLYTMLFLLRQDYAQAQGCTQATTFSNLNSRPMYLKHGFVGQRPERNGVLYMVKTFTHQKTWQI